MNLNDGYCSIIVGEVEHPLSPSFGNIAKLGNPSEIMWIARLVHMFQINPVDAFKAACDVLIACGAPEELLGGLAWSEWSNRVVIDMGPIPPQHVMVLAKHCIQYGICGSDEQLSTMQKTEGSGMEEFNPAEYIISATDYLGVSIDEAEKLTMAKFIRLSNAKSEMEKRRHMKQNKIPTKKESEARYSREVEMARQYEEARKKRKLKEQVK